VPPPFLFSFFYIWALWAVRVARPRYFFLPSNFSLLWPSVLAATPMLNLSWPAPDLLWIVYLCCTDLVACASQETTPARFRLLVISACSASLSSVAAAGSFDAHSFRLPDFVFFSFFSLEHCASIQLCRSDLFLCVAVLRFVLWPSQLFPASVHPWFFDPYRWIFFSAQQSSHLVLFFQLAYLWRSLASAAADCVWILQCAKLAACSLLGSCSMSFELIWLLIEFPHSVDCCIEETGLVLSHRIKGLKFFSSELLFHGGFRNASTSCSVKCLKWLKLCFGPIFIANLTRALCLHHVLSSTVFLSCLI
jgi:hypothetical protein